MIEPYGQSYGRYTNLGGLVGSTTTAPSGLDQYNQKPQINDRFNLSYQQRIWGGVITDFSYFYNRGSRVPYLIDLNMMDPAFRYEQKTLLNTQVANPFRNYLTVDKFPGSLRNASTVTLGSLLKPYPQYQNIYQNNTNGSLSKAHTFEVRAQRPFTAGLSFVTSYAYSNEQSQQWFDDLRHLPDAARAAARRAGSGGRSSMSRDTASPRRSRWQIPVGKDRHVRSDDADRARLRGRRVAVHRRPTAPTRGARCSSRTAIS